MKWLLTALLVFGFHAGALADDETELNNYLRDLKERLAKAKTDPEQQDLIESIRHSRCVIFVHKSHYGLVVGYEWGRGAVLVRDAKSLKWGMPIFLTASKYSLGPQLGGNESFTATVFINTNFVTNLFKGPFKLGGQAKLTATKFTASSGDSISEDDKERTYTISHGLYGGLSIEGGTLSVDRETSESYYNQSRPERVLVAEREDVEAPKAAIELAEELDQLSGASPNDQGDGAKPSPVPNKPSTGGQSL